LQIRATAATAANEEEAIRRQEVGIAGRISQNLERKKKRRRSR
jgi:hypothetical protein